MLSVMSLAFQGGGGNELAAQKDESLQERRKQIFSLYAEQMFKRKEATSLVFPKALVAGEENEGTFAVGLPCGGTPAELVRHKSPTGSLVSVEVSRQV
jgi:hypothetical protein